MLVHEAVRYMHDHRKSGDLLMDVPARLTWSELKKLAENRDGWRDRVRALTRPPKIEIVINDAVPGARTENPKAPQPRPRTRRQRPTTSASKYLKRDAHEAFFRPKERRQHSHRYVTRSKATKAKGLTKPKALTNKERAAWARAHYQQHHGTPTACPPVTSSPIVWSSPKILGHHLDNQCDDCNMTVFPPCDFKDMFDYIDNISTDRENLKNLSNLDPGRI